MPGISEHYVFDQALKKVVGRPKRDRAKNRAQRAARRRSR